MPVKATNAALCVAGYDSRTSQALGQRTTTAQLLSTSDGNQTYNTVQYRPAFCLWDFVSRFLPSLYAMRISESVVARIRCVLTSRIDSSFTDERIKSSFEMLILFAVQVGEILEEKRYLNDFIVWKSKCYYLLLFVHRNLSNYQISRKLQFCLN